MSQSITERWPATAAQQRILISERAGRKVLPIGYALTLQGTLDATRLVAMIAHVIERHAVLRTRFVLESDIAFQEVTDFKTRDLVRCAVDSRIPESIFADELAAPFDIFSGPLVRFGLLRRNENEHLLFILAHHILLDGWSLHRILKQLGRLYSALDPPSASSLSRANSFRDYALAEREFLCSEVAKARTRYWHERYRTGNPVSASCDTSFDIHISANRGLTSAASIPRDADFERQCRSVLGATRFEVLLCAYLTLLRRVGGTDSIWVEVPNSGRSALSNARVLGLLVQLVPMAFSVPARSSFREILRDIRAYLEAITANQLPDIASCVDLRTRGRRVARHDGSFNLIPWSHENFVFSGLTTGEVACPEAPSDVNLAVYLHEYHDRIDVRLSYDTAVFSREEIEEFRRQYFLVLEHILREPDGRVCEPSLVTVHAAAHLPRARVRRVPGPLPSILEKLSQRVAVGSYDVCYEESGRNVCIAEVNEVSERIAADLRRNGLERADVVAVIPVRSHVLPATLIALWKLGAVAALIDPRLPTERIESQIRRVAASAVMRLYPSAGVNAQYNLEVLEPGTRRRSRPACGPDTSVLLFTSGSTGEPKAVRSTHRGLAHFLHWQMTTFRVGAIDRVSCLSALAHDPVLRDLFLPLWSGAVGILRDIDYARLDAIQAELVCARPTLMHSTPSFAGAVLEHTASLETLRYLFLSGEALESTQVGRLRRAAPNARVVNFYGATETPQAMSYHVAESGRAAPRRHLPIGRGIDDVDLLIINDAGVLAGIGELGEIHIDTPFLSEGYFDDPGETAIRFGPNAFRYDGSVVYRTGDLGCYLPDGSVQFVRRCDDQVKIDGVRVEPAEISHVLARMPGIAQAHTMPVSAGGAKPVLVSFVVRAGQDLNGDALRTELSRHLPSASLPADVVCIEHLPLSRNGKIDRAALEKIYHNRTAANAAEGPTTATERSLARIVCDSLRVDTIMRAADLNGLGLTSLQAMILVGKVAREFGTRIRPDMFLVQPTLAKIAGLIDALRFRELANEQLPEGYEEGVI